MSTRMMFCRVRACVMASVFEQDWGEIPDVSQYLKMPDLQNDVGNWFNDLAGGNNKAVGGLVNALFEWAKSPNIIIAIAVLTCENVCAPTRPWVQVQSTAASKDENARPQVQGNKRLLLF
jgi:hypothetical protein